MHAPTTRYRFRFTEQPRGHPEHASSDGIDGYNKLIFSNRSIDMSALHAVICLCPCPCCCKDTEGVYPAGRPKRIS